MVDTHLTWQHERPSSIQTEWLLGPLFYELPGSEALDARAWCTYKLTAADWYIGTLRQLIERAGFDRFLGIEMALDGAFTSIKALSTPPFGARSNPKMRIFCKTAQKPHEHRPIS